MADSKRQVISPATESCPLSKSLEQMVLQGPTGDFDEPHNTSWGSLALTDMAGILREHGYEVKVPQTKPANDEKEATSNWSDPTAAQISSPYSGPLHTPSSATFSVSSNALARFHLLTSIMEQNRGEDGRVNATLLEETLLKEDVHAYQKEGVDQLKTYLMKARECGVPVKFDGDRSGLHQVWFKGHKDLDGALARYSMNRRPQSPVSPYTVMPTSDLNWRSRPFQQRQQQTHRNHLQHNFQGHQQSPIQLNVPGDTIRNSDTPPNRYRTPSERAFDVECLLDVLYNLGANFQQGASARQVEENLMEITQSLYDIKPGVKRFNHYLMNMRAAGAPIWFTRDDDGQPKEIFIKSVVSPPPIPAHFTSTASDWTGLLSSAEELEKRFASLIEAYQYHLQPEANLADGPLVQSRLEAKDVDIYTREQCHTFKQLLKLAKIAGLDINWHQNELGIATIRMRVNKQQEL